MSGQTADFELVPGRPGTFALEVGVPSNLDARFACDVHLGSACFERLLGSQRFQVSP